MTMTRAAIFAALVSSPQSALAGEMPLESSPPIDASVCVTVTTEARYAGLGYDHIVHLANACDVTQSCVVQTDVNPEPQAITVPPQSTVEVVTFIGSQANTFTAAVQCF